MHRIDHETAEQGRHGIDKAGFTGGDPAAAIPPTVLTPDFLNDVQEGLATIVEASGMELDKGSHSLLLAAMRRAIAGHAVANWVLPPQSEQPATPAHAVGYGLNQWIAVGPGGTITRSADGIEWNQRTGITGDPDLLDVCAYWRIDLSSGRLPYAYAVGENGTIAYSTDDGGTWTVITSSHTDALRVAKLSQAGVYIAGDNARVHRMSSVGTRDDIATAFGFSGAFHGIGAHPQTSTVLLLGDNGELQRSTGGGPFVRITSKPVTSSPLHDAVFLGDGRWLLVGGNGTGPSVCWLSTDDGLTWTDVRGADFPADARLFAIATDGPHVIVAGQVLDGGGGPWASHGTVWISRDRGHSFKQLALLDAASFRSLAFDGMRWCVGGLRPEGSTDKRVMFSQRMWLT